VFNIKEALKLEHSKRTTDLIVNYVANNKNRFKELMDLLLSEDVLMVQRASWPLSYIAKNQPKLLAPYWNKLLDELPRSKHVAFNRSVFRSLSLVTNLPIEIHGRVVNECMDTITDNNKSTASRVYAMYTMANMVKLYPDLSDELILRVEPFLNHKLPSIVAGTRALLKQIQKIKV
jgi:hypothetical protein